MAIRDELSGVLGAIAEAQKEPLAAHPLAHRITYDWREAVEHVVADPSYKVEGSPGKGNWAETVWLSVFDRIITDTARLGYYVVYLVARDGSRAYLSLNQATTEIYDQVGGQRYREVLEDTATRDVGLLAHEDTSGLELGPIDLGGTTMLTRGYEAGNIAGLEYRHGALPSEDQIEDDLTRMLLLYASLAEARDQVQADESDAGGSSQPPLTGIEARSYRWHRRAERSRSLAAAAKRVHGNICQVPACGKDLNSIYGEVLAKSYIEAHHLTPFADLDGRPTQLDPAADFAVVCPDCHRMLHKRKDPYTLSELNTFIEQVGLS